MMSSSIFLKFCAIALVPIALGYGAAPAQTMSMLYDVTVDNTNLTHILRAVMGLYLGMSILWFLGASKPALLGPALISCAVFMYGLAVGRILSLALDGMPHPLLVIYILLELVMGTIAIMLYRRDVINIQSHS